ncbi:uncharacterized protein LOC128728964 [Anopheles nili]|uniref:uncharacterized protein LOC128728964 n=1 Tax=Anopheles nili TaxID=185578 RepID=UPI00237BBEDB|nr:uncharacterized protein LOC128728964 [Anopheles nili]
MALVTIQRTISTPDDSSSDTNSADDEEALKITNGPSECPNTASEGTGAFMIGPNERLRASYEEQSGVTSNTSNVSTGDPPNGNGGTDVTDSKLDCSSRPTSSCSSGSSSSSSDIQQHLQSMFNLLRPEETLKMAVKLESLRPGRTRYLVVVSRTVSSKRQLPGAIGNISSTTWPLAVTATGASQQSSRPCSALASALAADTFVSSLENCVLSTPGGVRPPAPGAHPPGRSDKCDNKSNSKLGSSGSGPCGGVIVGDVAPGGEDQSDHGVVGSTTGDERDCAGSGQATSASQISSSSSTGAGGKEIEESCLLGIDCIERTTVGLVLKVLADTSIRLDGDGGFSVSSCGKQHIFKPVSVQAMWSALQSLHKVSSKAREHNFFAGGPSHDWVAYYETHIDSDRSCLNEWNAMDSLESRRPPSPGSIRSKPTAREETESVIRSKLKEVMMSVDLDDVTSKFIRGRLEELLDMDLGEYKPFIDGEMLVILGQMDAPTEIFDHVYLGSEWNASNLEELQRNGVRHILNVTREIDNFFPGLFHYFNVRVYDDEKTDLLRHWDNTFKYITRAKMEGSKVLVHCKMGISRSASVVIAYAMKANNWDFEQALHHVKEKRSCIKPNKNFLMQLETYQGMLDAMKNKEKLQRSKSETNLKLAGAKEGRSLPGSEPTPLIQALNGAAGAGGQAGGQTGSRKQTLASAQLVVVAARDQRADEIVIAPIAGDKDEGRLGELSAPAGPDEVDARTCRGRPRLRNSSKVQPPEPSLTLLPAHEQNEESTLPTELQTDTKQLTKRTVAPSLSLSGASYKPWTLGEATASNWPVQGRACNRPSSALKRHKSLSPDSLHPRWPSPDSGIALAMATPEAVKASRTRTMLGLDESIESAAAFEGPGATPGTGRRKQQSYSLEHLHGSLEMRSPCTETKTIRMPCGNGQNYSVSPNQIVHLQDKLPGRGGLRDTAPLASTPGGPQRMNSFLKKIFLASNSPTTATTTSSSESGSSGQSEAPIPVQPQSSVASTVPSTLPLSATTTAPVAGSSFTSSVKTMVSELECNSSSTSGVIPIAPPLLPDTAPVATCGVPIPIASVAAEAAAVAVASAIREASRKDAQGGGNTLAKEEDVEVKPTRPDSLVCGEARDDDSTNHPEQWDPGEGPGREPICWTSSAQIIRQSSAGSFPDQPLDGCGSVEICEAPSAGSEGVESAVTLSKSVLEECEPANRKDTGRASTVTRQCSWSSCDSSCTVPGTSQSLPGAGKRRTTKPHSSATTIQPSVEQQEPQLFTNTDREEIPWHPGTVKRTKERIEERNSHTAAAGTLKWATPATTSIEKCTPCGHSSSAEVLHPAGESRTAAHTDEHVHPGGHHRNRNRKGMVSTNYARLSASAPDSYNMYAEASSRTMGLSAPTTDPGTAKQQHKLSHQQSFSCSSEGSRSSSTSYCLPFRLSFRGGDSGAGQHRQQQQEADVGPGGTDEESFNAGKVRNLKMSFEAKSNDRRREQKKVRSLPSSPVAVHVSMGQSKPVADGTGTQRNHPLASSLVGQQPSTSVTITTSITSTTSNPPTTSTTTFVSSATTRSRSTAQTPPEDVTVRDLVDRYEVHGPRMRGSTGSSTLTRTQRPRSVFEPLKGGKPFTQAHPLSHSTTQLRLDESSRPPVPPLVRGLVIPPVGTGPSAPQQLNNNNNSSNYPLQAARSAAVGVNASIVTVPGGVSAKNNNNNTPIVVAAGGPEGLANAGGGGGGVKRTQQHGRTHPLAKINPGGRQLHHHNNHHHVHHHHHQYNLGQLQQHRLATTQGAGVSGTPGAANAYNTM